MGITHPALVIGFLLDLCNSLPLELRQFLIAGVGLGLGCEVTEDEDGSVSIKQVPRYEPLIEEKEGPSGLVLPPQDKKLIIP
jgi:hypothetical protein